jgi:hypothetical protein
MNTIKFTMLLVYVLCTIIVPAQNTSEPEIDATDTLWLPQPDTLPKNNVVGFEIGKNSSWFYSDRQASELAASSRGFHLGVLAEHRFNDYLSVAARTGLYITDARKYVTDEENITYETPISPVILQFSAHGIARLPLGNVSPYLLCGPNFRIPVKSENIPQRVYGSKPDLAFDLGIGIEKKCGSVIFAPEIRYTRGFNDIDKSPYIGMLYQHQLSFGLVIKG